MAPPLVAKLVRGYKVRQINVILVLHAADKTDSFGVGNRIGEGLCKLAVPRKFKNPILRELIWTEVCLEIIETGARTCKHGVDVVGMRGVIIDFEIHRAVRARVNLLPRRIIARHIRIEILDMGRAHAVLVVVAAVLLPLALQVARSDSNLALCSACLLYTSDAADEEDSVDL